MVIQGVKHKYRVDEIFQIFYQECAVVTSTKETM